MLRSRRLHRPVILIAMGMACCVLGYILVLHQDRHGSLQSVGDIPAKHIREFQQSQEINSRDDFHVISNLDKIGQIANLLGININSSNPPDLPNKIQQIEIILDKYRIEGDSTNVGDVLKQIQSVLALDRTSNLNEVPPVNIPEDEDQEKLAAETLLEHIENVLEQPLIPPPPIPRGFRLDINPYSKDPHFKPSTCSKTVANRGDNSMWFKTRYIPDIKMFLDKTDVNNFTNYYKLSHYGLPFGIKGLDRKLLARVLNNPNYTNPDLFPGGKRPKCVRCAVIGCGGVLNGSNVGEEIDGHDFVFRLNRALTRGKFGVDTGIRTSFYTFFPESQYVKEVQDPTAFYSYLLFKSYDVDYSLNMLNGLNPPVYTYDKGKKHWYPPKPVINTRNLRIIHPDFMRYVFTRFLDSKAYRPTTGALVVFLALHICDEVNMYGFGYDSRFSIHYYDTKYVALTMASVASHDVDNERALWQKLTDEHILYLYNRTDV